MAPRKPLDLRDLAEGALPRMTGAVEPNWGARVAMKHTLGRGESEGSRGPGAVPDVELWALRYASVSEGV